jgi:thiamine-monophosphate kinase
VSEPLPGGPGLSEEEIIRLAGALAAGAAGAGPSAGLKLGIGDDAAVLDLAQGEYVVTTDLMVEGVHFDLALMAPADVGWRAMAANLSDLAAMGALPRWGFLSLGLKPPAREDLVRGLLGGMLELGSTHGLALAGGDTVRAPVGLVNLCLIGAMAGVTPVTRAGARAGQAVCVTGWLGQAAGGLAWLQAGGDAKDPLAAPLVAAHRRPTPRLAAGRALAVSGLVTAMMDLSDGVASDLARLALASGEAAGAPLGAVVAAEAVPVSEAAGEAAQRLGADALAWALTGGEDFELLFTCRPADAPALARAVQAAEPGLAVTVLGEITAEPGLWLAHADGRRAEMSFQGYDHFGYDHFR